MIKFESSSSGSRDVDLTRLRAALAESSNSAFCDFDLLRKSCDEVKERARHIKQTCDQTVYIGIGGSYWTPSALETYFSEPEKHQIYFLDSPEARSFHRLFKKGFDLKRTHFVFISKSGTTLESLSLLSGLIEYGTRHGTDISRRSTLICSPGKNPMRTWAEQNQTPVIEIPEAIGGRYSSLTAVGLLIVELLDFSCEDFLAGAQNAKGNQELLERVSNFVLDSFRQNLSITQMWTYSESLWPVGQWWQQLWSESLAKSGGPKVSTPMVCCGPRDQHSLFQQLMEGEKDKAILVLLDNSSQYLNVPLGQTFQEREEFKAPGLSLADVFKSEVEGFCGALNQSQIPLGRISGDFSKIQTWGEFFMFWQILVAGIGFYLRVNPFDQPGVELGKSLARRYLKSMTEKGS